MQKTSIPKKYRLDRPGKLRLSGYDPAARPCSTAKSNAPDVKEKDKAYTAQLAQHVGKLQNRFFALHGGKLLLVLQGMDTSGKDGTIRAVFQSVDPLGVRVASYRAPSAQEAEHDFLWRHHRDVPGKGEIVIFNRSHYEAVLIEYVHGWIDDAERRRRFAHINAFEKLLANTGTTIIKCFLHIGRDEQRRRLQERIDDPAKHWKFDPKDLDERKLWGAYQAAYEAALGATATAHAPWHIVPSDSKSHRNLMVTMILAQALERLAPRDPPANPALRNLVVK